MEELKRQIINSLSNTEEISQVLEDILPVYEQNLIKNSQNPVFDKADRNLIMRNCSNLHEIGKSLYRYNTLKLNDFKTDAKKEFDEIEQTVLKGGISNYYCIWHAEKSENTCDMCKALDGKVFNIYDEVPERPHPHCRCKVEIVENKKNNENDNFINSDYCDCWVFFNNIDSVLKEANYLKVNVENEKMDISKLKKECENCSSKSDYVKSIINDLISLEDPINTLYQTISIFIINFLQLRDADTHGADKYFHAKANCEAAQRGIVGEMIAKAISDLRELTDSYRNIHEKKMKIEDSLKDIKEDQEANEHGRNLGRKYPETSSYELLKDLIPNGFPDRYKN